MKIVFFGSSDYVISIIKALKENFDLALVVTTEKSNGAVPNYCANNKIECLSITSLKDQNTKYKIQNTNSPIAVLADFGLIIPEGVLSAFPKGIINIHPSLLPKYRGPSPVQAAILNGDSKTGVSIMKLDDQIDHGPILKQVEEKILETDTAESLYKRLFAIGANLLPEILNLYINGNLKPVPQNHSKATLTKPLTRQSGFIDLSELKIKNSIKIKNLKLKIKAFYPWPGVWSNIRINDKLSRIKFLPEDKIQVEGKKPMTYKDFINGYPEAKGIFEKLSSL